MAYARLLLPLGIILMLGIQACSTTAVSPATEQTEASVESRDKQAATKASIDPAATQSFQLALNAIAKGNKERASELFTDMTRQYPNFSGPHTNLGLLHLTDGDSVKAEAAFNAAIRINPENAVAHNHLGIVYRQQGRFNAAEQAYQRAVQNKPDYANAHLNLGILYDIYLLKLDKALHHYQIFQSLQASEDTTVKKWIIGLKRRIKVSK